MQNYDSDKFVSCPPEEIWIDKNESLRSLKKSAIFLNAKIREFSHVNGEYKKNYK